jgi:hypothetical protein
VVDPPRKDKALTSMTSVIGIMNPMKRKYDGGSDDDRDVSVSQAASNDVTRSNALPGRHINNHSNQLERRLTGTVNGLGENVSTAVQAQHNDNQVPKRARKTTLANEKQGGNNPSKKDIRQTLDGSLEWRCEEENAWSISPQSRFKDPAKNFLEPAIYHADIRRQLIDFAATFGQYRKLHHCLSSRYHTDGE